MEIRFSRHAKNKLRLYKFMPDDVEEAIREGQRLDQGEKSESRYGKLRVIWVVVGSYIFVVTVIRTG